MKEKDNLPTADVHKWAVEGFFYAKSCHVSIKNLCSS